MATYWIADVTGTHALVEGDEQRDIWVHLRGWRVTAEPGPNDQVHIVNGDLSGGRIPYGALAGEWGDKGWRVGPPPVPADPTRDPVPLVQPARPVKTKAAASAASKEK